MEGQPLENKEKCDLCDMYFKNLKDFDIHIKMIHNDNFEGNETDTEDIMNNSTNERNMCYEDINNKIDKLNLLLIKLIY